MKKPSVDLSLVEEAELKEIYRISEVGDLYFGHLGYLGGMASNGNAIIPLRKHAIIISIDKNGQLAAASKLRKGRGPGELLDVYHITVDKNDHVYTYDQMNGKMVEYDSGLSLINEIVPPTYEAKSISEIYPMGGSKLILNMISFEGIFDVSKPELRYLVQFDTDQEQYGEEIAVSSFPYAPMLIDGVPGGGAAIVPYSFSTLIAYHKLNQSVFLFDTSTNFIAEVDSDFDTLRTIEISLPREEISSSEMDSIRKSLDGHDYESLINDYKAPADQMLVSEDEIWLKLNSEGEEIQWLVADLEGNFLKKVFLPAGSMIISVDSSQIGVRLDDVTFALYENPFSD